jgi:hypothetical protein
MSGLSPATRALVQQMAAAPRGPRRDGCFALWLAVRVVEDLLLDPPLPERAARRRIGLLERRLTSLTLPASLRRAITAALASAATATRDDASRILTLLVAPARDALGADVGEAVGRAARGAK